MFNRERAMAHTAPSGGLHPSVETSGLSVYGQFEHGIALPRPVATDLAALADPKPV